jgi:hypothetical protein
MTPNFMNIKPHMFLIATLAASTSLSCGSIFIQELFDGIITGDATLNGQVDGTTSIGMTGTWATNGSTGINIANNFNTDGSLPGLPSNAGSDGGVWNNTGSNNTSIYATRALANSISFSTTQQIFFSVRLLNNGDTAMGVGLAAGANGSAEMVGAGFTWNNQTGLEGQQVGNAAYVTSGTLDQDLADSNDGVYAVRAHEAANSVNGYGLLVGRITINATGNDVIEIKRYAPNAVPREPPWPTHSPPDLPAPPAAKHGLSGSTSTAMAILPTPGKTCCKPPPAPRRDPVISRFPPPPRWGQAGCASP